MLVVFETSSFDLVEYSARTGIKAEFVELEKILVKKKGMVVAAKNTSIAFPMPKCEAIITLLKKLRARPAIVTRETVKEDLIN